jgi:hypothetical protein
MDTLSAEASRLSLESHATPPTLKVNGVSICFVDSVAGVKAAVASALALGGGEVALDLEGVALGRLGRMSTLQLCAANGSLSSARGSSLSKRRQSAAEATVFVIDVATLGDAAFSAETGLRSLLEGDATKLFWDVRADAAALFHQFDVRINPETVIDVQLLATVEAINEKRMLNLPSLGGTFNAAVSVLAFSEKQQMQRVREDARKLYAPECGGSYDAWLARPLSPLLLEYAADVRFFGRLRASLSHFEAPYSYPLKAYTWTRIAEAQAPTYSNGDHGSAVNWDFVSGVVDSAPDMLKPRLILAKAETERLMNLPLHERIAQRGMSSSTMRVALGLLSGRRTDAGVSSSSLWLTCMHVAAHNESYGKAEWTEFMRIAKSSTLLTKTQRSDMECWLAYGGIPDDYDDYDDYLADDVDGGG